MAGAGPEQLFFEDAPLPEVGGGDVLVRVYATGITPAELTGDASYQNADGTPRIPGIPGHEVSGVVERLSADVTDFRRPVCRTKRADPRRCRRRGVSGRATGALARRPRSGDRVCARCGFRTQPRG